MEKEASEPLSNADTEIAILDGIVDYIFSEGRVPYDNEIEDFIKNKLKMDLPVGQYTEIIRRLKRKYRNKVGKLDDDLVLQDPHDEKLFQLSDLAWSTEDFSESDSDEDDKEKNKQTLSGKVGQQQLDLSWVGYDDLNTFERTREDPDPESLTRSFSVYNNPISELEQQFGYSRFESSNALSNDLYDTFKNTVKEGPVSILMSVMVEDAIPLAVAPPLQSSFNGEK